ncbi:MAG: hypothetical protein WDZ91_09875 [Paenibacillaceae bacterium]
MAAKKWPRWVAGITGISAFTAFLYATQSPTDIAEPGATQQLDEVNIPIHSDISVANGQISENKQVTHIFIHSRTEMEEIATTVGSDQKSREILLETLEWDSAGTASIIPSLNATSRKAPALIKKVDRKSRRS